MNSVSLCKYCKLDHRRKDLEIIEEVSRVCGVLARNLHQRAVLAAPGQTPVAPGGEHRNLAPPPAHRGHVPRAHRPRHQAAHVLQPRTRVQEARQEGEADLARGPEAKVEVFKLAQMLGVVEQRHELGLVVVLERGRLHTVKYAA